MNQDKVREACEAVLKKLNEMTDEELVQALESCDGSIGRTLDEMSKVAATVMKDRK